MQKSQLISIFLIISISILVLFIWWRWFELRPQQLDLITITAQSPDINQPLDHLLIKHLKYIQNTPSLLNQFRRPQQTLALGGFAINRCEVTQKDFRRFISWRSLLATPTKVHPQTPKNWVYQSQTENHRILGQLDVPLGGVSFFDAWQYCNDSGGRLPSAAEFEAISNGSAALVLYPWGNTFHKKAWQYQDPVLNIARRCGSYDKTQNVLGIEDLGNNVSEWTTANDRAMLMGGNAYNRPYALHALNLIRRPAAFDFRSQYSGFRCVYPKAGRKRKKIRLPWSSRPDIVFIKKATYTIGTPNTAKIATLLQQLNNDQARLLSQFPLDDKKYTLKVMRYEVSRALYKNFLTDPLVKLGFYNHSKQPQTINHKPVDWQKQKMQLKKPITNISWWSAWSFANWLGGRLPSAKEWQALAAAGLTIFPYGNHYSPTKTINHRGINSELGDIDSSKDDSKNAIRALSGNASEWTNTTVLTGNSFAVIIKGGSYLMPAESAKNTQISQTTPAYTNADLGFRVVFVKDEIGTK